MKSITNPIHLELLKTFSHYKTKSDQKEKDWVKKYLGSNKIYHGIGSKEMQSIAKNLLKEKDYDQKNLLDLLDSLYENATTFSEISIAALLLGYSPQLRKNLDLKHLDHWLSYTCGWAENDVLCQFAFDSEDLLSRWSEWEEILTKFTQDKNISKRRASLVLLTKSLRQSDDPRLSKLAFKQVEKLKHEKEILITKAVSWVLRSLVKFHQDEVIKYLKENQKSLPAIAYREALSKAETGRKYNKKS